MKKADWLNKLSNSNPKGSMTYAEEHQEKIDKERAKFLSEVKAGRMPKIMHGAFGPETKDSDAYIEEEIIDNGHKYKLYGCSYLYKGTFDDHTVHGIQLGKSLLSEIPMKFLKNPPLALGVAFLYLFQRKKLLRAVDFMMGQIEWRVMRWYNIPDENYNPTTREIKRAVSLAVVDNLWGNLVSKVVNFICLVLETDNAYRLRLQDAYHAAHIRWSGEITVLRILDILKERETKYGIGFKWSFYRWVILSALAVSPELRRIIRETIKEIDPNKIKMDEADWYFSLRFKSYNFRGLDCDLRGNERIRIDTHKHHIYFI